MQRNKNKKPFLIGIAGGISSGKSSVSEAIIKELSNESNQNKTQVLIISFDSFYKNLSKQDLIKAEHGNYNFDHPKSFDEELAFKTLINLIGGKTVKIPIYDKKSFMFTNEFTTITPDTMPDVIIIEGILTFHYSKIRELFNMKLFIVCDSDTRLSRRIFSDMNGHNRSLDYVLHYYFNYVKPAYEEYCWPTKKYADLIIPCEAAKCKAIDLIIQHIKSYLSFPI